MILKKADDLHLALDPEPGNVRLLRTELAIDAESNMYQQVSYQQIA
jgi:hypothetical protein